MPAKAVSEAIQHITDILQRFVPAQHAELALPLETIMEAFQRCDLVFQHAPIGIVIADADGRLIEVNRHFSLILGYDVDDLKHIKFSDITHPDDREQTVTLFGDIHNGLSDVGDIESRYLKKNREVIWASMKLTAVRDKDDRLRYWVGLVQDISERKQAEHESAMLQQQLIQSQRMEAIGTLAGGIAHDFNNILHTISGYSQLLMIDKNAQHPEHHQLREIHKAAAKASELTRQLLTFSRRVDSNLQPVDLNKEIREIKSILLRTLPKMLSIQLDLDDNLRQIKADALQIEQIVMNLCINASHAMPNGGRLVISTENVSVDRPDNGQDPDLQPGDYVLLSVVDDGVGMDEKTLKSIFEPFFTTKPVGKGTGLGLSMVYGIVKNHGGSIRCHSRPLQGTTFKVYLPVMAEPDQPVEKMPDITENVGGNETILIVDDDLAVLRLGENILSRFGYRSIAAESGETALAIYQEKKAQIDLVILDLNMPGMGGHECLMALLKFDPAVKVIISSGYSPSRLVFEVIRYGARDYVSKPFQISELLNKIRSLLSEP